MYECWSAWRRLHGRHARSYAQLPGVKVVAVSSRNLEKAAKLAGELGAVPTADAMSILADPAIEVVSIAVPTYLHSQLTLAALKAGKRVLLEKPFALDVAACDAMIAAQEGGQYLPDDRPYAAFLAGIHGASKAIAGRPSAPVEWFLRRRHVARGYQDDGV